MSNYGNFLGCYDPDKDAVYEAINQYYDEPILYKIKETDNKHFSIYAVKLYCLLNRECRYLIATKPRDNHPEKHPLKLKELFWTDFQARTLQPLVETPVHYYTPKRMCPHPITKYQEDDENVTYVCKNLPIYVSLLKSKMDYKKDGNLFEALETFQTILKFR